MNFCGKCGTKVNNDMIYCSNCGESLSIYNAENQLQEDCTVTYTNAPQKETADLTNPVEEILSASEVSPDDVQQKAQDITSPESENVDEASGHFDTGITYVTIPENKSSAGASVMGIISLVLGIFSLSSVVSSFLLTIDVYKQLTIPFQSFTVTASYAIPGIVAIILSQKAIDNGYKCGISRAAEITGAIGAFCHIGVLFIMLLGLFI